MTPARGGGREVGGRGHLRTRPPKVTAAQPLSAVTSQLSSNSPPTPSDLKAPPNFRQFSSYQGARGRVHVPVSPCLPSVSIRFFCTRNRKRGGDASVWTLVGVASLSAVMGIHQSGV